MFLPLIKQLVRFMGLQLAMLLLAVIGLAVDGRLQDLRGAALGFAAGSSGAVVFVLLQTLLDVCGADRSRKKALLAMIAAEAARLATTIGMLMWALRSVSSESAVAVIAAFVASVMAYTLMLLF